MATRILEKAVELDTDARETAREQFPDSRVKGGFLVDAKTDKKVAELITSKMATRENENGLAALWAAIETKSELALKLVSVDDVDNNETNEVLHVGSKLELF